MMKEAIQRWNSTGVKSIRLIFSILTINKTKTMSFNIGNRYTI